MKNSHNGKSKFKPLKNKMKKKKKRMMKMSRS